ncbi:MAG TPA: HIT family protein [Deltaproteobacteria bacterium]|jgi:histidine triad (HIT) family protein|nr:MAG: HIT domain protein [Bacteroidetes bacterium ADurb.BinA012]HNQ86425.1 HIT family protein [Deltaproteobacteria bacterium]HPO41339.1 HIT family protein [Bacteroidales bacterium]HNS89987.1 HIT family protein [Deltaproteobacteria bacterium]HOA45557.1 HIT family protein [Deltaproteobacteria bacterium]
MGDKKPNCIFCDIVAGRAESYTVYEDETTMCILDIHPYTKGHCLVIPRRHVTWWHEMTEVETTSVFRTARMISNRMMETLSPSPDFVFMYARGRRIPHTHIFLIPTYKDDVLDRFFHALEKFQESPQEMALLKGKDQMLDAMKLLLKPQIPIHNIVG